MLALLLLGAACATTQSGASRTISPTRSFRDPSAPLEPADIRERVALVIGNETYPEAGLKNPVNDARAMSAALTALGFHVQAFFNADRSTMIEALRAFKRELNAHPGLALFYYSGHGMQLSKINYLIPVDATLKDPDDAKYQAIAADDVLSTMEAAHTSTNLVILDACRDNPYGRTKGSLTRGLSMMQAQVGTLIAYATAEGGISIDVGSAGSNGVYTGALLKHLGAEGLSIEQVLKRTSADVVSETGGVQVPWTSSSLTGEVILNPERVIKASELLELGETSLRLQDYLDAIDNFEHALASDESPLDDRQRSIAEAGRDRAQKQLATLWLEVSPHSAMVRVDGGLRQSIDGALQVNPGKHTVEVSDVGYETVTQVIQLSAGKRHTLPLTLKRKLGPLTRASWVLGAVSVAALSVSVGSFIRAHTIESELRAHCPDKMCDPSDDYDFDAESRHGHRLAVTAVSTLTLGLGSAAAAALLRYAPGWFRGTRQDRSFTPSFACTGAACAASLHVSLR